MSSTAPRPNGPTLRESLQSLYSSVHLGMVTANLDRILDANDAFLRMIRYTREELETGVIDWRSMTPPDSFLRDQVALQQLRQFGASVPFEKEYILRDGTRLPMMMGAIRLREDPLEWMCYVVDLTDRKRAEQAEREARELQAKHTFINQIAHELNNPLAALTFLVDALRSRTEFQADVEARKMLAEAAEMLSRIAALTRAVLAAGSTDK